MAYWLTIELENGKIAPLPAGMDSEAAGLVYGTTVPQQLRQLDRIAQDLGVKKIDNFIYKDTRSLKLILQEAEAEKNAVLASAMRAEIAILTERPRWHEPTAAKATIHSLKAFLAANPQVFGGANSQSTTDWMLWDLAAYDRILTDLEQRGAKFAFVDRQIA